MFSLTQDRCGFICLFVSCEWVRVGISVMSTREMPRTVVGLAAEVAELGATGE